MTSHEPICPSGRTALSDACDAPCEVRARPFVLAATILASAMAFIDGSIVHIALPAIQQDFGSGFTTLQWVVNAYALTLAGLILVGGGAGDRFGRRRIFITGIWVFLVASIAIALAPDAAMLIGARALQGIGAALLIPQSLAILSASFPKEVRGRAIGIWAGASAITTALGPALGGALIDWLDWRAAFWINLPLSAAALWLTMRYVPESRDRNVTGTLDWIGGTLAVIGFGGLTMAITDIAETGAASLQGTVLGAAGVASLALFLWQERRARAPLMPLDLFASRAFSGANAMTLFLYGALTAVMFLLPFELIARRGLSASEVGLTLLPLGLIIGLLSRPAGAWADKNGARGPLAAGALIVASAAGLLALNFETLVTGVVGPIVLLALGMSLVVAPLTTVVMNSADDDRSGAASGVNNAASRLAGLFAVAIAGSFASLVFAANLDASLVDSVMPRFGVLPPHGDPARALIEPAFARAYATGMWLATAWACIAALVALFTIAPSAPRTATDLEHDSTPA